jgi:hypothetical protein
MIGETDGPPGALSLALALLRLGKTVRLLTDDFSAPLLTAGGAALGTTFPIDRIGLPQAATDASLDRIVASFAPTHVIAVERPGDAVDGHRYSMKGVMLDDLVPSVDRLFSPRSDRKHTTLAIGDGGNELGLGGLPETLMKRIPHGDTIFSASAADHVIVAGTSNFGAYALAAALSLLSGKLLIQDPARERTVLEAMIAVGAVDGCTHLNELSVDGIPWPEYSRCLEEIFNETKDCLSRGSVSAKPQCLK